MKKFGKLRPEQIAKSLQVFAELKADRCFWKRIQDKLHLDRSRASGASMGELLAGTRVSLILGTLDVELEDAVIAERLARWSPPRPPVTEGVLVDWHLTATQFPDGAMLRGRP